MELIDSLSIEVDGSEITTRVRGLSESEAAEMQMYIRFCVESKLNEFAAKKPHKFVGTFAHGPCGMPGCDQLEDQSIHDV